MTQPALACFCADSATLSASKQTPFQTTHIAVEDWDLLFDAVKAKLRAAVGALNVAAPQGGEQRLGDNSASASVLACVEALEQLHAASQHARDQVSPSNHPYAAAAQKYPALCSPPH